MAQPGLHHPGSTLDEMLTLPCILRSPQSTAAAMNITIEYCGM